MKTDASSDPPTISRFVEIQLIIFFQRIGCILDDDIWILQLEFNLISSHVHSTFEWYLWYHWKFESGTDSFTRFQYIVIHFKQINSNIPPVLFTFLFKKFFKRKKCADNNVIACWLLSMKMPYKAPYSPTPRRSSKFEVNQHIWKRRNWTRKLFDTCRWPASGVYPNAMYFYFIVGMSIYIFWWLFGCCNIYSQSMFAVFIYFLMAIVLLLSCCEPAGAVM